jgi:hypothetical protein
MARAIMTAGCTLLLLSTLHAQNVRTRLRSGSTDPAPTPAAQPAPAQPSPAPAQAAPASAQPSPAPAQPAPAPAPSNLVASETAPSLLQQPAQEASIVFDDQKLTIHADNSSLAGILHQVASSSGMKIEGLAGDERVFGTFGPGAPRDVLADLLHGTAYNVALIGDLDNGAPRQLLLTPATHGAAATPAAASQANSMDDGNEADTADTQPPPPDVPQQPPTTQTPPTPGVRTPQQLFEQLQHMRQQQGAQGQQPPVQQDSPQQ